MLNYWLAQGCGNTFVIFNFLDNAFVIDQQLLQIIRSIITKEGVDTALILIPASIKADYRVIQMLVYEQDGSFSNFCGNGARAVGAFLYRYYQEVFFGLACSDGIRNIQIMASAEIFVDMLHPKFESRHFKTHSVPSEDFFNERNLFGIYFENSVKLYFVEIGEPHLVTFHAMSDQTLERIGENLNTLYRSIFPDGININVVHEINKTTLFVRTYERGVNRITKACGSGSMGSAIITHALNRIETNSITILMKGGMLRCELDQQYDHIHMIGEATIESDQKTYKK